jgi:hypothetical protein
VPPIVRLVKLALVAAAGALAVWFEAVRRTPEVKARKRQRRRPRVAASPTTARTGRGGSR